MISYVNQARFDREKGVRMVPAEEDLVSVGDQLAGVAGGHWAQIHVFLPVYVVFN